MFQCMEKWKNLYSVKLHWSKNDSSLRKIAKYCEDNLLDEESLHFIRIARYVSKIPQITISEDKKVAEQSVIEFFHSFDLF